MRDNADFRAKLKTMWFGLYNRQNSDNRKNTSNAFEHIFMGERDGGKIKGAHGWVYFAMFESADNGSLDYYGHRKYLDFGDNW